jgi:hypothetical protein
MAHAQKPDFVVWQNGRVHLNRQGASVQSTTGSRGVHISGINAGYTMFRGSVKGTGYPLHAPVFSSLPLPCATVCHHVATGLCSALLLVHLAGFFSGPSYEWHRPTCRSSTDIRYAANATGVHSRTDNRDRSGNGWCTVSGYSM